ncbi:MAG: hypothetical protein LBN36_04905 [Clostridiales Family XIII bacterium]|jgi:hypothetical protein|nr:hypothetical protein [Clostridiales Family XIII bacterium]
MNDQTAFFIILSVLGAAAYFMIPADVFPGRFQHSFPETGEARRLPFRVRAGQVLLRVKHTAFGRVNGRIRDERVDREIFDAIALIRNLVASGKGASVSADALLEQFAQGDGLLKTAYAKALTCLRRNRKDRMIECFTEEAGTAVASDFIRIIARWDEVTPEKLASTLQSYQNAMKEMRTTALKRRSEFMSDVVFFPVIINVLVVFMNFIYVAYYLEQKELLDQLFF